MRYDVIEGPKGGRLLATVEGDHYEAADVPSSLESLAGQAFDTAEPGLTLGRVAETGRVAPVRPSKIVCVGRNFRQHAEELDNPVPAEPLIFLKPPSALIGDGDPIERPSQSEDIQHEAELAFVVGRRANRVSEDEAAGVVAAYTCANDVTARDLQSRDKTFTRGKGFDTFCPVGPGLVPAESFEPSASHISCRVEQTVRQQSGLDDFIFSVAQVVSYVSDIMTLEPGDLVLTGTPSGVGPLDAGDTVDVEVDGIGTLSNPVVDR